MGNVFLVQRHFFNEEAVALKGLCPPYMTGKKYVKHNPVIALTITDFVMLTDKKLKSSVITSFKFMETAQSVLFPDNQMEMVFVELPKFDKKESELRSMADKWIYFIKEAWNLTTIPETLTDDESINHAVQIANAAGLTPMELEIEEKQMAC